MKTKNDNLHSHLEMIQKIINRLSQNSFLLKGWSVLLVSALLSLPDKSNNWGFIVLPFLPAIAFMGLDSYFLRQERLFRALYDHVRELDNSKIDYSMNISIVDDQVESVFEILSSKTILLFHGTLVMSIALVMLLLIN